MFIRLHSWLVFWRLPGVLVCSFAFVVGAAAQEVLAPPPPQFVQTNLVAPNVSVGTNALPGAGTTGAVGPAMTGAAPQHSWLDWGPVHLHPHLLYRFSYGDGLQAQPGQQSKTAINQVSPGLLIDLGDRWKLDYTPTLRYYSSRRFKDSLDHSVALNGGAVWGDWSFGLSQSYATSSQPLVETGSQTDTETFSTGLNAVYRLNDKISFDSSLNQNFRFVGAGMTTQQLSDSKTWTFTEGLNYQMWPRVSVGLSLGATYDDLAVGSDMLSEQLQARLNWRIGQKLTISLNGGFEDRQFLNSSASSSLTPIFSLAANYQLFEVTSFSLTASRTVSPSYFSSQVTESTGFTAGMHQRLLQKLSLDISGGFNNGTYAATTRALSVNREDNHTNINIRLTCPFLKRGSASIFYDWSDNTSNENGFAYTSNQVGVELGYRY